MNYKRDVLIDSHHINKEEQFYLKNGILNINKISDNKIPFSLWVIIFYFLLIFILMPGAFSPINYTGKVISTTHQGGGLEAVFQRVPLVVGLAMITISFITRRPLPGMGLSGSIFLIFSFNYLLSGLWGPDSFLESCRLFFATTGIGLCIVFTIRNPRHLNFFLNAMVLGALVNAIYGLLFTIPGLATLGDAMTSISLPSGRDLNAWRLIGLLKDPTNCGLLLMVGFLIILDRLFEKLSLLNITLILVLAMSIFLTFSRTTWVATLAGIIFLMGQKKITPIAIVLTLIIGSLFFYLTYDIFSFSIKQNLFRWDIFESDTRSGVWFFWLDKALKNPFGHGIGYVAEFCAKKSIQTPHNIYLSIWVEGGLQTLMPLLALLWICFKRQLHIRKYIEPDTGKNYGPLLLSLLIATSISLFALSFMSQLLFIAMGLCISASLLAQDGLLLERFTDFRTQLGTKSSK